MIQVVEYDPRWPSLYKVEETRILGALSNSALDIQHVGSTAVSGLGAKPIIDIMVAVADLAVVQKCIQPLEALGYEFRGEAGIPGRLFFGKGSPRTHNLHMVGQRSDFWENLLLFRDFLRAHPDEAKRYYELKKELAGRFGADPEAYNGGKTRFIESGLTRARTARATKRAGTRIGQGIVEG
jgi:GrpB-like predicted nucleotidyltransferase (UPF0157 family)